jgi:hypothetical protein
MTDKAFSNDRVFCFTSAAAIRQLSEIFQKAINVLNGKRNESKGISDADTKITQACEIIIFFCGKRFNR